MKKRYKILKVFFFILVIIVLLGWGIIKIIGDKDMDYDIETIMIRNENYNINISYPEFNNDIFNNKIKKMVNEEKADFLQYVKEDSKNEKVIKPLGYDLNIHYNYMKINHLYSIHFKILRYVGGAHYERDDLVFYYDKKKEKEVYIDDLIMDKKGFYNILRKYCKKYLLENKEKLGIYPEEDLVMEGLNHLEYIVFSETNLIVLFPPYLVGPWSSGEIVVPIDYHLVKNYLRDDYFRFEGDKVVPLKKIDYSNISNVQETVRDKEELSDKKLVALTFDDGPSFKITERLLDGLNERDAKVSFFMVGNRVKGQEKLVKRIYDEGHTIGSHTYDHKNFHNLEMNEVLYEINETNRILKDITGVMPRYLRPPYGNYNEEILKEVDMSFILWSVDTEDWKKRDATKVCHYLVDHVKDGDIVLLHDIYNTSVEGVLKAIDELKKEGFVFVSIDEMIRVKGIDIQNHKVYRYFK